MNHSHPETTCPNCGGPIPADSRQGLCPKCALAVVSAPTEAGQPEGDRPPAPGLEAVAAAFPQLEILELIGQGGMGTVYRARQPRLDRFVALKILAQLASGAGTFAERFNREARVLARLSHPGIVSVYDYGEAGGFFFLLMEFVDGVNLRQAMKATRFTPAQALALVPKICESLQYAHDEGILHRDIKPENILLDTRGRVKIADFGIAKLIGDKAKDATLTASGLAVGTPHYMAPEQLEHPQDVDQRADIYSLGVVFYELLTGELPIGRFAPPSQKTTVDPRVDEVVLRALERERERRQHNVTEVRTGVEQITANPLPQDGHAAAAAPTARAEARKTSLCYVTTPEHLNAFRGRWLYLYQSNGQLRLDANALSLISCWLPVTIPLASIRALTLGEFSLTARPVPLFYLGVTYVEAGASRTLFFTPTRDAQLPVPETNQVVEEWAGAVRTAVQAATGRALTLNRAKDVRSRFGTEVLKGFGMTSLLCSWAFPLVVEHRLPTRATDYLVGLLIAAGLVGSLMLLRWLLERRALARGNLNDLTAQPLAYDKDDPILFGEQAAKEDGSKSSNGFGPSGTMVLPRHEPPTATAAGVAAVAPGKDSVRRVTCYLSTPARMRDCFPGASAHIFLCGGELRLNEGQLTFTSAMRVTFSISLEHIQHFGLGLFRMWNTPWLGVKYARLNYLVITYAEKERTRTVMLTPVPEGATSATEINAFVAQWHDTVQAGIRARRGVVPELVDRRLMLTGVQGPWLRVILPLLLCCLAGLAAAFTREPAGLPVFAVTSAIIALLGVGYFKMNGALKRGELDAVTSDEPLSPELTSSPQGSAPSSGPARISWMAVASAVCSIPSWLLVIGSLNNLHESMGPDGLPPRGFTLGLFELLMLATGGFVGVAALFLGTRALQEIRDSLGRMRGARLAVVGLLGIPTGLLVRFVPAFVASSVRSVGWEHSTEQGEFLVGGVLLGLLLLVAWAAWALRRWARRRDLGPGQGDEAAASRPVRVLLGGSACLLLVLAGVLAWKTRPPAEQPPNGPADNSSAGVLLAAVPEPTEAATRGLALYGWECGIPAAHMAIFTFALWSNGAPHTVESLSGWAAAGPARPWRILAQWKLTDGGMLSPGLGDHQRWDVTIGIHGTNVWMPKSVMPRSEASYRLAQSRFLDPDRASVVSTCLVQGGGYQPQSASQPDGAFALELQLQPLPARLSYALRQANGTAGGGTHWQQESQDAPARDSGQTGQP